MKYSDKQTDRKIKALERQLKTVYASAWTDVSLTITEYAKIWAYRDKKISEGLENGTIEVPAGETAESYMRKWRMNHIGMGKRWESVKKDIADRMVIANQHAAELINKTVEGVYAVNRNYQAYQIESAISKSNIGNGYSMGVAFNLVNEKAARHLESGKKQLLPKSEVDVPKDERWNMRKVQAELLAGILAGKSIDKIAKDFRRVTNMGYSASIRNARTACNGAMNAGKQQSVNDAVEMGIDVLKEWVCTLDSRTRDTHQALDGERVKPDEVFSNGCMFPADPNGEPKEVYNCRCVLKTIIPGLNDMRGKRIAKEDGDGQYVYLDNVTYRGRDDSKAYAEWFQGKIDGAKTSEQAESYYEEGKSEGLKIREQVLNNHGKYDTVEYEDELYNNPVIKGIGAKSMTYPDVEDPFTGEKIQFVIGKKPMYAPDHNIAGKGNNHRKIDDIERLLKQYPGSKENDWVKDKARYYAYDEYGEERIVELHWYYASGFGRVEYKAKVKNGSMYVDEW